MNDPRVIEPGERMALDVFAAKSPTRAPTVFDVGANVGDYAIEVLQRFPDAALTCFDPQAEACLQLETNVQARFPGALVEVVPLALSDEPGPLVMWRDQASSYHASAHRTSEVGRGTFAPFNAWATTLDAYCSTNGVKHIHWLKLDTEGHELAALGGAKRMMVEDRIDVIQFEFGENAALAGYSYLDVWSTLVLNLYALYRQSEQLELIPAYDERDELIKPMRNYLAVHRGAKWLV